MCNCNHYVLLQTCINNNENQKNAITIKNSFQLDSKIFVSLNLKTCTSSGLYGLIP